MLNNNKKSVDTVKKQDMPSVATKRNDKVKNKLLKDQMQKHTNLAHTAIERITKWTCAGMAQTQLTDLKDTKL